MVHYETTSWLGHLSTTLWYEITFTKHVARLAVTTNTPKPTAPEERNRISLRMRGMYIRMHIYLLFADST